MRQYFNWKTYFILMAVGIFTASLYFTNQLATKLAAEEKRKVEQLALAIRTLITSSNNEEVGFATTVLNQNLTIPLIITDDNDNIQSCKNIRNLDSLKSAKDTLEAKRILKEFKTLHPAIVSDYGIGRNYIYYGESYLLTQLRYFPYVQLVIIVIFLIVLIIALSAAHRSIQNQVWVGLSKETAHQLGTPLSAIEGWLELLKDNDENQEAVTEMQKDIDRLKLVADRFSKIGSAPQLEEENLMPRLENMVAYMQKRAPSKVTISLETNDDDVPVYISGPLFDWVLENLIRNALDAMDGKGRIDIKVHNTPQQVWIDVCDTGKGIHKHQLKKVFSPGFTTKKRGWGLGLSLARRIIEKYHHGSIFVKHSEQGKGTTFRIILRR